MSHEEHNPMLRELLAEDSLEAVRQKSLEQGMAIVRRRRRRSRWTRAALGASAVVTALCFLVPTRRSSSARNQTPERPTGQPTIVVNPAPAAEDSPPVRFISDEELLALFPGRSRALIGPPGHQELVFLGTVLGNDDSDADPTR